MASVYPTIIVEDEQKTSPRLQRFYFQSKSGRTTEISAINKSQAETYYKASMLPTWEIPPNDVWCCCIPWRSSPECNGIHCPRYKHYAGHLWEQYESYRSFFRNLLTSSYPDFFTSGRFETLYREIPTVEEKDWSMVVTHSDGRITRMNPRKFVYRWEDANITLETSTREDHTYFNALMKRLSKSTDNLVCYEIIRHNLPRITADHWDRLLGSWEALTERPTSVEIPMEEEVRKPTTVRRRKGDYELISLHETS